MWEGEVRRFATIGSTNAYLLDQARAGAPAGLVAVADHQSAGRGRLDRSWESPPGGGLLVSVLLRPVLHPADLHCAAVACTLALAAACRALAGVAPRVKWPNDLVIDDAKLAGVLAEADPTAPGGPAGSVAVVVGLGCNLTWAGPAGVGGTCLADHTVASGTGAPPGRDALLEAMLEALGGRLGLLDTASGRAVLMDELRRCNATLGRQVRVMRLGADDLVGEAVAITDAGHLVLRVGGHDREIATGDVLHLRHAP
jgi:BirA family biotin operon repressor/biotin-[acetyl-CoA-carboxylase] ligase